MRSHAVNAATVSPRRQYKFASRQSLDTSTAQWERPERLYKKIEALFEAAKEEVFEDGIGSVFSKGLTSLVNRYGNDTIAAISPLVIHERVNTEVASETLRCLGRMGHPLTYSFRMWLLERSLRCPSARVRDSAALGLASLDDPRSIPYLRQAIQQERVAELQEDMLQVLEQLEATAQCHYS